MPTQPVASYCTVSIRARFGVPVAPTDCATFPLAPSIALPYRASNPPAGENRRPAGYGRETGTRRKEASIMNLSRLARRAKDLVDKRGGTESLKADAAELRDIARRKGSAGDKAKEAFEALKEPGAPDRPGADASGPPQDVPPGPAPHSPRGPERPPGG
jgi:hypothetical protein